ncbi:MAG: carboxypeptidase-like regulatory domain-containing protein [Chitinophagales bacterium]
MKSEFWVLLYTLFVYTSTHAQNKFSSKDSTLTFKVYGNCQMCKDRIEAASKGKGVKSAIWSIESKILTLNYDPSLTSVEKIDQRIVDAGHDTQFKTAKDFVYDQLPECCHYREKKRENSNDTINEAGKTLSKTDIVTGVVLESDHKGNFHPLPGASVVWLGSGRGVVTDENGIFKIYTDSTIQRLAISYTGYETDTIAVHPKQDLRIILASGKHLQEVKVTTKLRASYISLLNPIRTQVMTDKELFKAACCNLSESFETNPSVDVSYNDAVTGSKQIQLLGLSGNYTQLTVENLPGPRGIATPLGLNSIAGSWVESIQLTKGIGSVANGYESIAGQINIELKKPETAERLFVNAYVNDQGKTDLNLNLAQKLGRKWSTGVLVHDDFLNNQKLDFNKDGFRDLPTGNLFSAINRWKFDNGKGWLMQFGIKTLNDARTGGETNYNSSKDKFTTNHYGLGINTDRYEEFAKIGYVFPRKKYKSFGWQLASFQHRQDSYFGLTTYNAKQNNFYSNFIYQSIIGTTANKFRTGLSFVYDQYKENFRNENYNRNEIVPGAFFEYTYTHSETFSAVAGLRIDHNNLFGFFITPRLHLRYEPVKGTTIRLSGGRGERTANIFAENLGVLISSRQVNVLGTVTGKAYGLDPEIAWNEGISIDQKFKLFNRAGSIAADFFRTDFQNQVVVDVDKSAREVNFYNLAGRSYSNSFQFEVNQEIVTKLDIRLAYRLFDVKTTYHGDLLERPLVAKHRAFANLAYELKGWKFDYTITYNGTKRIPFTRDNPVQYQLSERSPSYILMNAQITKTLGKKHPLDIYLGSENLTNYYQKNPVLASDQPFGPYFDASLVWGPISGRMFYTGLRYWIK